jgi:serine/threonine protein phosphatase 1
LLQEALALPAERAVRIDGLRIPPRRRIYAVGDVHGRYDLLKRLHARIEADEAFSDDHVATEVYLGDMVDRGPESALVLVALMKRALVRDVVLVAGNHELAMIQALDDYDAYRRWLDMGGRATVASFHLNSTRPPETEECYSLWQEKHRSLLEAFARKLVPSHAIGGAVFVHAGIRPAVPLAHQRLADLTSIREPFLSSTHDHGYVVVHGHTPVPAVDIRANRINVDAGAYATGNLGCVRLEGDNALVF